MGMVHEGAISLQFAHDRRPYGRSLIEISPMASWKIGRMDEGPRVAQTIFASFSIMVENAGE
jgi:hypothetical protein